MTALAPALQAYFTERLTSATRARKRSPPTATRSDCCRGFAAQRTGKQPFELDLDDLDAPLIGAFLKHVEQDPRWSS